MWEQRIIVRKVQEIADIKHNRLNQIKHILKSEKLLKLFRLACTVVNYTYTGIEKAILCMI